jgi:parvulin-like peptidyl-prolyl isomerase
LILTSVFLTACSKNTDKKTVVAKVDGEKIFKSEYNNYWENVKTQYGITVDILMNEEHAQQITNLKNDVLKSIVTQKVMKKELEEMGYYNISEEEHNQAKASRDSIIQNMLVQKQQEMLAELGEDYTEEDIQKVTLKYTQKIYEEFGITEQELLDFYIDEIVIDKAKRELIKISVTEDDIKEKYDENVERDKNLFKEDLSAYEGYKMQGYKSYYTPEGLRMVRHVLVAFDDETQTEIRNLRMASDNEKADELVKTNLEKVKPEADEVYKLLVDGEISFDDAIKEYNDDPGMDSYPDGYMMSLDSISYVQPFTDAGMALEKIGDFSEPVATDFGYHIIQYSSDVPSGTIDIGEVRDSINDELISNKTEEAWLTLLDSWTAKHDVEYFFDELKEEAPSPTAATE